MVANGNGARTEQSGVVAQVNDRGLVLEGHEDWINVSKFAGPLLMPGVGDLVVLSLDKAGYIRSVEVTAQQVVMRPALQDGAAPDRDHRILRQAVLNTATAILGSGGRETCVEDVLQAATVLEVWVLRGVSAPE